MKGGKIKRDRLSRDGLPRLEDLPKTLCCERHCGAYITVACYECARHAPTLPFPLAPSLVSRLSSPPPLLSLF